MIRIRMGMNMEVMDRRLIQMTKKMKSNTKYSTTIQTSEELSGTKIKIYSEISKQFRTQFMKNPAANKDFKTKTNS